jgi:FixJ family two-component response regulator
MNMSRAELADNTVFAADDDAAARKGLTFPLRAAESTVEAFLSAWPFWKVTTRRDGAVACYLMCKCLG